MRKLFWILLSGASLSCSAPPDARSTADVEAVELGAHRAPSSEEEKRLLAALDELPPGQSENIGRANIAAGPPYFAASGATCRKTQISGSAELDGDQLACKDEQGWFFVPDLGGTMDGTEP